MARSLSFALERVQLAVRRQPTFRVLVYDVASTDDDIGTIVRELALDPTTGPRDFTGDVISAQIEEAIGDYASSGVAASVVTLVLADPNDRFNPLNLLADPTGDGRWLRRGNVVRVIVGDAQVPEADWVPVFTGKLVGQAGVRRSRASGVGPVGRITIKAVSREAEGLRFSSTSESFGLGASYVSMAISIAQTDLGLDVDEILFPNLPRTTGHRATQFVEESPLASIAKIFFVDGFMPRYDGRGRLAVASVIPTKAASRVYLDGNLFFVVENPFTEVEPVNSVCILGLDADLSKVVQPKQQLAEVQITTGYFTQSESVDVFWSEDRTQLAQNVDLNVVRSVNGGLIPLGGSESFDLKGAPGPEGTIGAELGIDTGFAPELIIFLAVIYVLLAVIPDEVLEFITIPVGRVIQAIELALMLIIMTKVGRGIYLFEGEPFEYVFKEIRACAETQGLRSFERNELEIENPLVQDQSTADQLALDVLTLEQAKGNARRVEMLHDLLLEPGDVFELAGRRFFIQSVAYALVRGEETIRAQLDVLEVTAGTFV